MDEWRKLLNHVHGNMKDEGISYKQAMMVAKHYNNKAKASGCSDPADCTKKAIELFNKASVSDRKSHAK